MKLMDTLRKSGMGNAKMFTKEDLEKMEGQSLNKKKKKEEVSSLFLLSFMYL